MNFRESIAFLESLEPAFGTKFELKTPKELLKKTGTKFGKMKFLHIAGTNGKGSVSAMASRILQEAGYRTGLYTSPHLLDERERVRVNGKMISEKDFARKISELKPLALSMKKKPTYFEVLTIAALNYFLEKNVDVAVVEVGLGGRLDATNVIDADAAAITSISFDHAEFLGNSLEKIAKEKAEIIKARSIVVVNAKNNGFREIAQKAEKEKAKMIVPKFRFLEAGEKFTEFDLIEPNEIRGLKTKMLGVHQIENAALAVSAVLALKEKGLNVDEKEIRKGLLKANWPGRLQLLKGKKRVLLDGAHNPGAIESLSNALDLFERGKLIVVFGVLADKPWKEMLSIIERKADALVFTQPKNERALNAAELKKRCKKKSFVVKNVGKAVAFAKKRAGKNDLVLVCGSLYTVGEAMRALKVKV